MSICYQKFDLPADGLTRVEEIGSYRTDSLRTEGWTMVGVCSAETSDDKGNVSTSLFGVFRMTSDDVVKAALAEVEKHKRDLSEAAKKKNDAERQLADAHRRITDLMGEVERLSEAKVASERP